MKTDFQLALEFSMRWEGGFVHHPNDPGGRTNKGITQLVYDEYRYRNNYAPQSVARMTDEECRQIYREFYWDKVEKLLDPHWKHLRVVFFDTYVQFGEWGAIKLWQKSLGIKVDGIWGPITTGTTRTRVAIKGSLRSALDLVAERIRYRGIRVNENRTQIVFLNGWLNRDVALMDYVLGLQ
jgi:lysozyme family protein